MSIHWVGHGLPFRTTRNPQAYGLFSRTAGEMPPLTPEEIAAFETFKNARVLAEAQEKGELPPLGPNPVGMEWCISIRAFMVSCAPRLFMYDFSYDLTWEEANGRVSCAGMCVAETMPEFFARLKVESDVWRELLEADITDLCYGAAGEPKDVEGAKSLMARLSGILSPRSLLYVRELCYAHGYV